jgi:putative transposase
MEKITRLVTCFILKGIISFLKMKIFRSLASNLQIDVTYAIPYNAKAKPIERVFNTFEEQLGKKYPSYAGSNAKQRPEDLKELDIMDVITLEEFIEHHNRYVYEIYNNAKHSGDAMGGKSPNQAYADIPFTIRRASKEVLYFSLMRVKGQRTVQRNGITFKGIHFYNDNCINYIGQKVTARYDPTKPEILYVFDVNENFLFVAEEIQKQGWNLTDEDYQRENQRKKIARQKALNSYTADNVVRSTEAVGERLKRQAESMEQTEAAKPKTVEIVRNEKIEENIRCISMSDMERNYEDVLNQNRARKKAVSERQKGFADKFKKKMLDRAYEKQA